MAALSRPSNSCTYYYYTIIRRHRSKAISHIGIDVTVPRSVCLYLDTFVRCAQTAEDIDTISVAYDSFVSLPDRVKIPPLPPQILSQIDPPPVSLIVGDIRWQCSGMVRDSAMVTIESL